MGRNYQTVYRQRAQPANEKTIKKKNFSENMKNKKQAPDTFVPSMWVDQMVNKKGMFSCVVDEMKHGDT